MQFVRKVYGILASQLSLTAGLIVMVQTSDNFRMWMMRQFGLAIAACVFSIVTMISLVCCGLTKRVPINYILLFFFTLCESWMIAGLTASYDPKTVMMAGATTALTTIALTIYALRTKTKVEVFGAMAFLVYLAMFPLIIISWVVGLGALKTLYCALGVVLYGLFLIIDTMMICRGKCISG